ncbi:MAG: UTP--glucose-1-phosphate uridylyltransferase [Candidatus Kerfeldbacteria bacterium]|nr:UTP--glucose-1-phosphate uridylyltransferase [Candidatus Kerfeldbacteria bacterium]
MPKKSKRQKIRKAVIPVAGFGTRFLPATIAQPKEMLTVVDKPVIQYIVEEMAAAGIEEIIFVTGRNKRAIEDHFDYSPELEQSLRESHKPELLNEVHRISKLAKFVYVRQSKMLGIANALYMAKELIGDEPFAFSYGDDIIHARTPAIKQLFDTYRRTRSTVTGTMKVSPDLAHRYGIMQPLGRVTGKTFRIKSIIEKPKGSPPSLHFSPGRYVFTPDIFRYIEKTKPTINGEVFLVESVNLLARRRPVYAHQMSGRYFDCGSKREYVKANIYFALQHRELRHDIRAYLRKPG